MINELASFMNDNEINSNVSVKSTFEKNRLFDDQRGRGKDVGWPEQSDKGRGNNFEYGAECRNS